MRVVAVLTGLVLAAAPHKEQGADRAVEIADTMVNAIGKMVAGVEHFLDEAKDIQDDASAHAFIGDKKQVTSEDLENAAARGEHLAHQMARNLQALQAAAKALQQAARDIPKAKPLSEGERDGYVVALENKVAGQKKAIEEMDVEKQSLVTSVANLMHRGADTSLQRQLADARKQVVELEQAANAAAKNQAAKTQASDELQSNNALLAQRLDECQSQGQKSQGKLQESVVNSEVQCKAQVGKLQDELQKSEAEKENMVQTVQVMVKSSDELKAQLQAKANCTVRTAEPAPQAAAKAVDVAHMGDTVKIDQYIATNGHPTPTGNASDLIIKPVHFQAASVKAATDALAGRGDIGKYLRGAKDENAESVQSASKSLAAAADADAADLDQQIDSLMPEDVDVLKAADAVGAKKVRKATSAKDDNLAQKLLLQAEQTLKLAQ